jgi:hypothetical protein
LIARPDRQEAGGRGGVVSAMSHLTDDIRANIKKLSADIEGLRREAKHSANDADRATELSLQIMQLTERRTLLEKNLASA